jgi:hypothetical protein
MRCAPWQNCPSKYNFVFLSISNVLCVTAQSHRVFAVYCVISFRMRRFAANSLLRLRRELSSMAAVPSAGAIWFFLSGPRLCYFDQFGLIPLLKFNSRLSSAKILILACSVGLIFSPLFRSGRFRFLVRTLNVMTAYTHFSMRRKGVRIRDEKQIILGFKNIVTSNKILFNS